MSTDTAALRMQWKALELEILVPAVLTHEQWGVIAQIRERSHGCLSAFRKALPFTVARFKDEAQREILAWAQTQTQTMGGYRFDPFVAKKYELFERDLQKIHHILFNVSLHVPPSRKELLDCYIGPFKKQLAGGLHVDNVLFIMPLGPTSAQYASRVGALPIEVIAGKWMVGPLWIMIAALGDLPVLGDILRMGLRKINVLTESPLGEVALLADGWKGIFHSSSYVPKSGAYSAFFRKYGSLPTAHR
jgi:hypothetical protein